MNKQSIKLCSLAFGTALSLSTGMARSALASDPYPGDDIALPPGVNLAIAYNYFSNAGSFGPAHGGGNIGHSTRIVNDFVVARYVHYFSLDGLTAGLQAYIPYVGFIGNQELGINPSAATFGQPVHANLSKNSGFAQPNLGAAIWPINEPASGTYLVLAPWISPPISSAPGIYQSFGGKQTYAIHGGPTVDSGNRTNETQLRLVASTFLSPTMQVLFSGDYDIAAHGGL